MTKKEAIELIDKKPDAIVNTYFSDMKEPEERKLLHSNFEVKEVESFGGEGLGDQAHVVLSLKNNKESFLVKIDGSYDSWDGYNWDYATAYECKPVEKTITVYERVK
jgi:hypothetical protein